MEPLLWYVTWGGLHNKHFSQKQNNEMAFLGLKKDTLVNSYTQNFTPLNILFCPYYDSYEHHS